MTSRKRATLNPTSLRSGAAYRQSQLARSIAFGVSAAVLSPLSLAEDAAATSATTVVESAPVAADIQVQATATEAAATPASSSAAVQIDTLEVKERTIDTNPYAEAGAPYKARISGDERHVRPLAETPQTITVLTQEAIQDSGRTDLKDVLAAQPGITLGTGENGNAFGDRYIIRGYEARSDVFVDSLRDPGMTIRESFATEQVEISKGASSTFAGRGTVGGGVNGVTKQASTEYDFTKAQIGMGTDEYRRVTLDANSQVNDTAALRLNLLQAYEEVPDREPADRERNGLALAGIVTPTDKLQLLADVYHLEANDKPDLGTYIPANGGKPVKDIPVYLQSQDFLESEVNVATVRLKYEISDDLRISNALRYGTADNGYVATGARGTTRGTNDPFTGVATITLSSHNGWQAVENLANQFNVFFDTDLAGKRHQFIFGAEYTDVNVVNGVYTGLNNTANYNCITGTSATANNAYCIIDENGDLIANIDALMGRSPDKGLWDSDYEIETVSLSVMDTIELSEKWDIFAGLRADSFDYRNVTQNTGTLVKTEYAYDDVLFNYHFGLVREITREGNVYLTYSTASEINGGESDLGANCGYGGVCVIGGDPETIKDSKPESTENIELGTKWNLFDEKLLATAAIFRTTKDDVMEGGNGYAVTGTLNTGKNRVEGIEIGLSGNITERLSTQFGAAFMEAEVLESAATDPGVIGRTLSNFADNSVYLQLRYAATDRFAIGGVANYVSERYAGQPDSAAAWNSTTGDYSYEVPAYTTVDLFAEYELSDKFDVRLNVNNVTDKDYYLATYRSGAFTYIGDGRNANLTLSWEF